MGPEIHSPKILSSRFVQKCCKITQDGRFPAFVRVGRTWPESFPGCALDSHYYSLGIAFFICVGLILFINLLLKSKKPSAKECNKGRGL